ncbi:acetylxylan esterase [Echinicola marina]|uniref:alpha/beta hydrolase family protein n=1 Tax=Echinicola marina TaxID=2859768 RepID=UPI001CF63DC2|nr:prolyl oligopeptidase family serine peptidase [Echinicola marina]UCS91661.1 acetylxylan esterase [Echinicola marina]
MRIEKTMIWKFYLVLILASSALSVGAQNFDESKVPPYTLPEVLKTYSNKQVKTVKRWEGKRRPEILSAFEENVYGHTPDSFDSINFSLDRIDHNAFNGKATLKQVLITIFNHNKSIDIRLSLYVPNKETNPVPAFLLIHNRRKERSVSWDNTPSSFWPAEKIIDNGYAVATFGVGDLAPDNKDTFMNGAFQLFPSQLEAENGMRTIGAWAWGASRVMDYFMDDQDIDAEKVGVVGHSRGGKTALWAAAQDQRFAICFTNCSGNTGAALSRRWFGETIRKINTSFPHWFTDNYKKFNDHEDLLPVDQHMLIALVAPRPVYATSASEDLWADPKGTFLAMKNAEPAYNLYKLKSALPDNLPELNEPIINSYLGYHIKEGKHSLALYDWENFIKFADFHFKAK